MRYTLSGGIEPAAITIRHDANPEYVRTAVCLELDPSCRIYMSVAELEDLALYLEGWAARYRQVEQAPATPDGG